MKVLLIHPFLTTDVYEKAKVKGQVHPSLTLATLAAPLLERGHSVEVLDLMLSRSPLKDLHATLDRLKPQYIGITFTTPSYPELKKICQEIKRWDGNIPVVCGGPHATAAPEAVLNESAVDVVAVGEADFTMVRLVEGEPIENISGIAYRNDRTITFTPKAPVIANLDELPLPAWRLFDLRKYKNPRSFGRSPLAAIETSRGCPFQCVFCNKNIFGHQYRAKSPERVVKEFKHARALGFNEIYIADDGFTTDLDRAKRICDLISRNDLNIPWNLGNGVRVDKVDLEFLKKARSAGCYRVHFGIETADDRLLKRIKKDITIPQVRSAVLNAKKAGLDTVMYFMYGFPGETEQTMQACIDLAVELDPDFARVSIVIPYPGTALWEEFKTLDRVKSFDWSIYTFHNTYAKVFEFPGVDMDTVYEYYHKFYRSFYYRGAYIIKRFMKGVARGTITHDFMYFLRNFLIERPFRKKVFYP